MGTSSITLSPDVERFVSKQVESGQYATKDEAVNAILQKQMRREWELAWLKQKAAISLERAECGEFVEFDAEKIKAEGHRALPSPGGL